MLLTSKLEVPAPKFDLKTVPTLIYVTEPPGDWQRYSNMNDSAQGTQNGFLTNWCWYYHHKTLKKKLQKNLKKNKLSRVLRFVTWQWGRPAGAIMLHLNTHCVKIKKRRKKKERWKMLGRVMMIILLVERGVALSWAVFPGREAALVLTLRQTKSQPRPQTILTTCPQSNVYLNPLESRRRVALRLRREAVGKVRPSLVVHVDHTWNSWGVGTEPGKRLPSEPVLHPSPPTPPPPPLSRHLVYFFLSFSHSHVCISLTKTPHIISPQLGVKNWDPRPKKDKMDKRV